MTLAITLRSTWSKFTQIPYVWVISALVVLRFLVASLTDLVPDEAYYWLWAQHLNVGYYDHPPMVAWFIAFGTALFGDNSLGVRATFILSFLGVAWFSFDTSKILFGNVTARRTLLWLNLSLLLSVGTMIATPDPPSVLFWAGCIWALAKLNSTQNAHYWLAFGLFAGLGVLAKYTNFFLGLGVVTWIVFDPRARKWLRSPWLYAGAMIAILTMAPNIWWNIIHDMATITKQFGRVGAHQFTLKYIPEFIFSQLLLINPLIVILAIMGTYGAFKAKQDGLKMLILINGPLMLYLLLHVFHDRIQGNWPAPIYPSIVIIAAYFAQSSALKPNSYLPKLVVPVGLGLCLLAFGLLAATAFIRPMPGLLGLNQGWRQLAQTLELTARQTGATYIVTDDYDLTGQLSYQFKRQKLKTPIVGAVEPERYPWQTITASSKILIVARGDHNFAGSPCFVGAKATKIIYRNELKTKKNSVNTTISALNDAKCVYRKKH